MKESRYQQFEIVVDSNPTAFRDKLNETLVSLSRKRPVTKTDISGDTFKAIIEYEEVKYIPETAEDELEARVFALPASSVRDSNLRKTMTGRSSGPRSTEGVS